ncbi:N-acetylmuramic acid 6-phosphate etherase [Brachybacterium sp. EF45031]|uniref:N-acetylmuramic acid 6-phosphate etherase n=1 Tax=Brachybacterium sillae TaxID=2810536 RepID=UPI00217D04DD|nr:N-acetylmuramic acid 6-phosphate etherase [Brachybacterium sillae]MCS6712196.1 N-acetylmuramic acid 6-phosphate etherase [Brachybacterium sillae]
MTTSSDSRTAPAPAGETWRDLVRLDSPTEERNPRTRDLDTLGEEELVARILAEDATVVAAVQAQSGALAALAARCVETIDGGGTVHYVGAGTSGRLGVLDAVELVPTYNATEDMVTAHLAGGPEAMMRAVEGAEDDPEGGARVVRQQCTAADLVIGLAASGRTPFVRGALQQARDLGAGTALIAANPRAPLAEIADIAVLLDVGPEVVTGSTRMKAATAQKIALNTLSTATMVRLGTTYENLMIDVRPTNEKLVARTVRMLVQATGRSTEDAAAMLEDAGGSVRVALVALLAGVDAATAAPAVARHAKDPDRIGDPAGIRTAVEELR